jgi:hypothetical protein
MFNTHIGKQPSKRRLAEIMFLLNYFVCRLASIGESPRQRRLAKIIVVEKYRTTISFANRRAKGG